MLEQVYYNNTLLNWIISGGILIAALIVNWLITIVNNNYLKVLDKRTKSHLDNILARTLETPLKVGIILVAIWTALSRLDLSKSFDDAIYKAYQILTVLNITWFLVHLVNGLISEYFNRRNQQAVENENKIHFDSHLVTLIRKLTMFLIWTIGIVTALNNVGLDLKAILGTLGISGIAIALAAQDTVKNIFGGFTILLDGTFRIGDTVKIGEFEGTVEDIGVRSTKIRNYDRRLIIIPNYKIVEGAVTNISSTPQLRVVITLGLVYKTSPEKMNNAIKILETIAKENMDVADEGTLATFDNFGDFALNIRYCYYVTAVSKGFKTISSVNSEIFKRFNEAGIEFAFPTQTLQIEKTVIA
ncbi:MAG: mechanosensitive ion channel family protein [Paludibacteraceae bacterium]